MAVSKYKMMSMKHVRIKAFHSSEASLPRAAGVMTGLAGWNSPRLGALVISGCQRDEDTR